MEIIELIKQLFCFHNYSKVAEWIDFDEEVSETKIYRCQKCNKIKKETKLINKTK